MSIRERIDHIVELLRDAELDETKWQVASALIDDACGLAGNDLLLGQLATQVGGIDIRRRWLLLRSEPHPALEREYAECYAAIDERPLAGVRGPAGKLVHTHSLLTDRVRRTSVTYNEYLRPRTAHALLTLRT